MIANEFKKVRHKRHLCVAECAVASCISPWTFAHKYCTRTANHLHRSHLIFNTFIVGLITPFVHWYISHFLLFTVKLMTHLKVS